MPGVGDEAYLNEYDALLARRGGVLIAIRLVLPLLEPAETKQSRSLSTQSQITLAKIVLGRL